MDSTGLTTLMDAHLRGRRATAGRSRSGAPSPAVRRVFDLAGVGRLLDE